jgi:uncharacterized protein (TIGR02466 family)
MELYNLFSTPIAGSSLTDIDNQTLENFCKKKSNELNGQSFLLDLDKTPELHDLSKKVLNQVNLLHKECGLKYKQKISDVWCNVGNPSFIIKPHTHPSFFTSVYYVTNGKDKLNILNPISSIENLIPEDVIENYNSFNQLVYFVTPVMGLLITHPSWLLHYVDNQADKNRVSIVFDTIIDYNH